MYSHKAVFRVCVGISGRLNRHQLAVIQLLSEHAGNTSKWCKSSVLHAIMHAWHSDSSCRLKDLPTS